MKTFISLSLCAMLAVACAGKLALAAYFVMMYIRWMAI